ncbi:hypothetical protein VNI00_007075 [Paramarasmius palmivorus]|uniref:Uncharacterized protein n=1 Tax=Paramarasmius palmivorus TaxID=297713 RepID=A0AAW0D5H4_9AGAR
MPSFQRLAYWILLVLGTAMLSASAPADAIYARTNGVDPTPVHRALEARSNGGSSDPTPHPRRAILEARSDGQKPTPRALEARSNGGSADPTPHPRRAVLEARTDGQKPTPRALEARAEATPHPKRQAQPELMFRSARGYADPMVTGV